MSEAFPPSTEELLETFDLLFDWEEKYEYLIELGKQLPDLPEALRTEENRVHGCMSTVWLSSQAIDSSALGEKDSSRHGASALTIQADSDSLIVRGLIVVLLGYFNGKTCEAILKSDPDQLFQQLGFDQSLSANRRNGLASMIQRVKADALKAASGV